ncbi:MAG: SpoIIE family protein phosphatase [Acidimicrobiales bacterium]
MVLSPEPAAPGLVGPRPDAASETGSGAVLDGARTAALDIRELLEQILRDAPLPEVLDGMVRVVEHLNPGMLASTLLMDSDGRHLRHGAAPSLPDFYNEAIDGLEIGPSAGSCGTAAYEACLVVAEDIATDPRWAGYRELAAEAGLHACWSMPIQSGSEVLGTFAMYHPTPRSPSGAALALAEDFARVAALAIVRDRVDGARRSALSAEREARREAEESARQMASLQRLAVTLASASTKRDIGYAIVDQATSAMGAAKVWFCVANHDRPALETVATSGCEPEAVDSAREIALDGTAALAEVSRTLEPLWFPDGAELLSRFPKSVAFTGVASSAVMPFVGEHGECLGAIALGFDERRNFSGAESDYLGTVVHLCAQALKRADRSELDHRFSVGLQRSLLSRLPSQDWAQMDARYLPSTRAAFVGGDWYDAFTDTTGDLTLAIGDVNGHDVAAAATMGQFRSMVRALAYDGETRPARIVRRLDQLNRSLRMTTFTSLVLARLRRGANRAELIWSNAGHPPPIILAADGVASVLWEPSDVVIGPDLDVLRSEGQMHLAAEATLLFYTDGLVERPGESISEGIDRLVAHATEAVERPLPELVDHVLSASELSGADDVALLAVRVV